MKQQSKNWMALIALSLFSLCSFAQERSSTATPRWVSDKGYWVIESNINTPLDHIIRFYTNDNVMIYKETVNGVKLNPTKRKVKMKLKKVLETSLLVWEQKKVLEENKNYVAAILK